MHSSERPTTATSASGPKRLDGPSWPTSTRHRRRPRRAPADRPTRGHRRLRRGPRRASAQDTTGTTRQNPNRADGHRSVMGHRWARETTAGPRQPDPRSVGRPRTQDSRPADLSPCRSTRRLEDRNSTGPADGPRPAGRPRPAGPSEGGTRRPGNRAAAGGPLS